MVKPSLHRQREQQLSKWLTIAICIFFLLVIFCFYGQFHFLEQMRPGPYSKEKRIVAPLVSTSQRQVLVLHLQNLGDLRIVLRPDWSRESVEFLTTQLNCQSAKCEFYRAEKPGILQGRMPAPHQTIAKGPCPLDFREIDNKCPEHDPQCACHGPMMKTGMVGWAGGATGTDFFIDHYEGTADWWGTQHTVFGQLQDDASHELIQKIWERPVTNRGGMEFLDESIPFTTTLEATA